MQKMNLGGAVKINKYGILVIFFIIVILLFTFSNKNVDVNKKSHNQINLRKLLIGLIQAANVGGYEVKKISSELDFHQKSKGKTLEGVDEPVTLADKRSHCSIQLSLNTIFPNLNMISEESVPSNECPSDVKTMSSLDPTVLHEADNLGDENVDSNDLLVFIDPLDATKEFTEKLFFYVTVMICVVYKGEPIIGVIHSPFANKTYWAWKGRALSENLKNVKRGSEDAVIRNPVIIVSRSHTGTIKEVASKAFGDKVKILTAAGSGYKVLSLIEGNATVYLHNTQIKKWDICAGHALLNSLNGKMTTMKNEKIHYSFDDVVNKNGIIATLSNHQKYYEKLSQT